MKTIIALSAALSAAMLVTASVNSQIERNRRYAERARQQQEIARLERDIARLERAQREIFLPPLRSTKPTPPWVNPNQTAPAQDYYVPPPEPEKPRKSLDEIWGRGGYPR